LSILTISRAKQCLNARLDVTFCASCTMISDILSEWNWNNSESSSMPIACSSCSGLWRYCSEEWHEISQTPAA
jgi:hypothetical protein